MMVFIDLAVQKAVVMEKIHVSILEDGREDSEEL